MLHTLYAEYILICQSINQSIWGTTDTQYRSCSLSTLNWHKHSCCGLGICISWFAIFLDKFWLVGKNDFPKTCIFGFNCISWSDILDKITNHTMFPCISYGKKKNKIRQTTKCKTFLLLSYTCYSYMVKTFSKDFLSHLCVYPVS